MLFFCVKLKCQTNTIMLLPVAKYSTRNLICDINFLTLPESCDMRHNFFSWGQRLLLHRALKLVYYFFQVLD